MVLAGLAKTTGGTGASGLAFWLVSSDVTVGATLTNQWLDRIQGIMAFGYGSPTNSSSGMWFDGVGAWCSNRVAAQTMQAPKTYFVGFKPITPPSTFGAILSDIQSQKGFVTRNDAGLYSWGTGVKVGTFVSGTALTAAVSLTTTNFVSYTNGVPYTTNANAQTFNWYAEGAWDSPRSSFYKGYLIEVQVYTNILTATDIANVQASYAARNP